MPIIVAFNLFGFCLNVFNFTLGLKPGRTPIKTLIQDQIRMNSWMPSLTFFCQLLQIKLSQTQLLLLRRLLDLLVLLLLLSNVRFITEQKRDGL